MLVKKIEAPCLPKSTHSVEKCRLAAPVLTLPTFQPRRAGSFSLLKLIFFSRYVRGWSAHENMETDLVIEALNQAVTKTPGRLCRPDSPQRSGQPVCQ